MPDTALSSEVADVLNELRTVSGVKGASLIRHDGLLLADQMPDGTDMEQISAMTASVVGSGKHAYRALAEDDAHRVVVHSQYGKIISAHAHDNVLLTVLTAPDAELDAVNAELDEKTEQVANLL